MGVGGSSFTTSVKVSDSTWLRLSVTDTVNVCNANTTVDVPEICPVLELKVSPAGRLGEIA